MIPVLSQILPAIGQVVGGGVKAIGGAVGQVPGAIVQVAKGGGQAIAGLVGSGVNLVGQTAGGIGQVVKTADWEGIANVAGAGYGIYTSIEANKLAKQQMDLYEKALGREPTPGPMTLSSPLTTQQPRGGAFDPAFTGEGYPPTAEFDQQRMIYYGLLILLGVMAVNMLERG